MRSISEEDPFIQVQTIDNDEVSVLLYGALQKEILAARLEQEFGVKAVFGEVKLRYVERPIGVGEFTHEIDRLAHQQRFWATIRLRIEPAAYGTGIKYQQEGIWGSVPAAFHRAIEETVYVTLRHDGLFGFPVTDCLIKLIRIGYASSVSTAADFRGLTPIVLGKALKIAKTQVFEPYNILEIEIPEPSLDKTVSFLNKLGVDTTQITDAGPYWLITSELPVRLVQEFTLELAKLSSGEGAIVTYVGKDRAING